MKGRESNLQFDSWPEKVRNRPDLLGCKGRATYRWKALNKSYNFASDRITIRGLFAKLWGSKAAGVPFDTISRLPLRSSRVPGEKSHLDVGSVVNRAVVSLVCPCCPWFILAPKVLQLCTNHFVWVVCKPMWVSEACQLFLVPSQSSNMPLYPSKCCELRSVARLLPLPLSSTWTHIWVLRGVGSASYVLSVTNFVSSSSSSIMRSFGHGVLTPCFFFVIWLCHSAI
jgi:hypothetical protein